MGNHLEQGCPVKIQCKLRAVVVVLSKSCQLFATPWTVAHQDPLSWGFPRQEYWNGLHFLLQGIFPPRDRTLISCIFCIGRWILYQLSHWGSPARQTTTMRSLLTETREQPHLAATRERLCTAMKTQFSSVQSLSCV